MKILSTLMLTLALGGMPASAYAADDPIGEIIMHAEAGKAAAEAAIVAREVMQSMAPANGASSIEHVRRR
jgi:hypothetical protein